MGEEDGAGGGDIVVVVDTPHVVVCKGKRSKRQRVHAAPATVITAESSSSDQEAASGCVTEEEEDMALCLMLLARGGGSSSSSLAVVAPDDAADSTASVAVAAKEGKFRSRRPADGGGEFVYECRTCGRCFPSFQALGGHRTSHKKPRLLLPTTTEEKKKQRPALAEEKPKTPSPRPADDDPAVIAIPAVPATPPKQESAATATSAASRLPQPQQHRLGMSSRVHECSICGAEFASGQALGGHMRRHRPLVPASASAASSDDDVGTVIGGKEKSLLLELDLNMPAPCDDAASLPSSPAAAILFRGAPASALVDCHY